MGSTSNLIVDFHIREHCHINENVDGDRFVGIKVDSENAMIYFPIGYELPDTDEEIRSDIKHLIQVLSEFTSKTERLLAIHKYIEPMKVDFPIHAYKNVIEYYLANNGQYYIETDTIYKTGAIGKQNWSRTIKNQIPLVQCNDNVSSLIYTSFTVRSVNQNSNKLITQINRFCVYEAFKRLGWLYVSYMPEEPGPHPNVKASIAIIRSKLFSTYDDRKKSLFQGMLDMLEFIDEETSEKDIYFGTDNFEFVWEKMIDKAFGEADKENYFPRSKWVLKYGSYKDKYPLMPDTIMIHKNKYYVLDAKYYRYGWTANPNHLPNGSSINKQITYGEYLEKYKNIDPFSIFNAFIMPYNKLKNHFNLSSIVGTIGEALGDWRNNVKYYEHIQGIVIDTRYIMFHYSGNPIQFKSELVNCIEEIFIRRAALTRLLNELYMIKSNTVMNKQCIRKAKN